MNIKQLLLFLLSILITGLMSGCGTEPQEDLPTRSTKGLVGSSNYIIKNPETNFVTVAEANGITMNASTAGGIESIGGFAIEKNNARALGAPVDGLITTGELREAIKLIQSAGYTADVSTINEQVFSKYTNFTVGDYTITTTSAQSPVSLANQILNTLNTSAIILPNGPGSTSTSFRMFMTVTSFNNRYYYTVSISPSNSAIFEENFALMTALSSGTNYTGTNERLVSIENPFAGKAGTVNQADFLFVIDDSGSMGDKQDALSTAATDFEAALNLANMNFNLAIITTSDGADGTECNASCYDRSVLDVNAGIMTDINIFKAQIDTVGTIGSGLETGIYNAEQSLRKTANGDSSNGLLNSSTFNFPRAQTQLSIIILSDEVSQYPERSGGIAFNPSNNLFLRDGYLVNALVDIGLCGDKSVYQPGADTNGQYDKLAVATGGLVGNICNGGDTPNFSAIMQNIVFQAAGKYKLTKNFAKPNSITVTVNGLESRPSIKQGYMYIEGTNSIAFFGVLPLEGASVNVYFEYPKPINLFDND
ncbi:hypothetical protein JHD50_07620 [Sulfurimonas sp. MAG313]|nr:hypothetical protein [Sulfurimonas sp. MAG313]MDF1881170.1 hypothetical protein [Sulfurimonas sp. MAG313]